MFVWLKQGMDELRQSLLLTTMELENTRLKAQEELKMRDDQLFQLKDLLSAEPSKKGMKHKNNAKDSCLISYCSSSSS